jgi:hypothetical protein
MFLVCRRSNSGRLLQLRVLRLGFFQDGDVGVFPEGQEILVGGADLGGVTLEPVGTGEAEMREGADTFISAQYRDVRGLSETPPLFPDVRSNMLAGEYTQDTDHLRSQAHRALRTEELRWPSLNLCG